MFKRLATASAIVALMALGACDKDANLSAEQRIERAVEYKLAGKLPDAVIELKNALRQAPDDVTARFLLGEIYTSIGDGRSAEKELEFARANGIDDSKVLPLLAEAWLLQREYKKVIEEIVIANDLPLPVQLSLKGLRGEAALGLGDIATAETLYQEVLSAAPQSVYALVGMGYVNLRRQQMGAAQAYLEKASDGFENNEKVLKLRGELNRELGNYDDAEVAFTRLVQQNPGNLYYLSYLAWVQSSNKKYDLAERNIDLVLSVNERSPIANHIKAVVSYYQQDFEAARNHADIAFKELDTQWGSALLGGASAFALGEYEQAYNYMIKYVDAYPADVAGRKLLAKIQIRLGQIDQAMSGLESVLPQHQDDPELLSLIAQTALQRGDLDKGREFLERTRAQAPENSLIVAQLGRTQYALGQTEEAIGTLREAVEMDPDAFDKQMLLLESYIRSDLMDDAIVLAAEMQQKFADRPEPIIMEGVALGAKKDREAAIAKFNQALTLKPGHPDASRYLMVYASGDENWDEVRRLLKDVIANYPMDIRSYLELYRLEKKLGNTELLQGILEQCLAKNPDALAANYLLAQHYVSNNEFVRALPLGRKVVEMSPTNPAGYEVVGLAELNSGQTANAVTTFTQLSELQPNNAMSFFYLAQAYEQLPDWGQVVKNARRGLGLEPSNVDAQISLARAYGVLGEEDAARKILDSVESKNVSVWRIDEVYADLAYGKKDFAAAADNYRAIFVARQDARILRKLAVTEMERGNTADVISELVTWRSSHPEDFLTGMTLGAVYLKAEKYEAALELYEELHKTQPENLTALNNLTALQAQLGMADAAWKNAQVLAKKAPSNAVLLDTVSVAALAAGKKKEAVEYSAAAMEASINPQATIILNHAKALLANGNTEGAIDALKRAIDLSQGASSQEAQILLEELQK